MKVALFITCLTDTFFPRVGEAVTRVLRRLGCEVHFPLEQTCCGQPAHNSGFHDEARAVALRWIEIFEPYEIVVTPSASCAAMIKHHAPALFADDPELHDRALRMAERVSEFSVFLTRTLGINWADILKLNENATFHYPCHARHDYSPDELAGWLSAGNPERLRPPAHADLCCGFGGLFAVDFPEISGGMLRDRLEQLDATNAGLVVCNEGGCALNLLGGAKRQGMNLKFKHMAELLAESLGLMEPQP